MKLFDTYVQQAAALLRPALEGHDMQPEGGEKQQIGGNMQLNGPLWPTAERNPFIMERDTAAELGGYPKESINLILSTSAGLPIEGIHRIGGLSGDLAGDWACDRTGGQMIPAGHQSFGKIVFLQTEEIPEDEIYDFQQRVQLADLRLQLRDVMVRSSSRQYLLNLRVGKKAIGDGFDLEILARTIHAHFRNIPKVKDAAVVLIAGDSPLYRQLMPAAERVREITAALNTMFEGIEMDCGSCSMSPVCDEVEDLRRLHQKKAAGRNG